MRENNKGLPVAEVAVMLGTSVQAVYGALKRKKLHSLPRSRPRLVPIPEVLHYMAVRKQSPNPSVMRRIRARMVEYVPMVNLIEPDKEEVTG